MMLFVTIGNCEVIFCRLMILYTHYFPIGVFYIMGILYHVQFFPMNVLFLGGSHLLLSSSHYRWFPTVLSCLRWFQLVPCFSMYKDQQSEIPASVVYKTYASSRYKHRTTHDNTVLSMAI